MTLPVCEVSSAVYGVCRLFPNALRATFLSVAMSLGVCADDAVSASYSSAKGQVFGPSVGEWSIGGVGGIESSETMLKGGCAR